MVDAGARHLPSRETRARPILPAFFRPIMMRFVRLPSGPQRRNLPHSTIAGSEDMTFVVLVYCG